VISRLGAFVTPYGLAMFILGLWLGYLGAVEQYRACQQPSPDYVAVATCPEWTTVGP
jgi:hypothetical protein